MIGFEYQIGYTDSWKCTKVSSAYRQDSLQLSRDIPLEILKDIPIDISNFHQEDEWKRMCIEYWLFLFGL